jgi:hypothetical protein
VFVVEYARHVLPPHTTKPDQSGQTDTTTTIVTTPWAGDVFRADKMRPAGRAADHNGYAELTLQNGTAQDGVRDGNANQFLYVPGSHRALVIAARRSV